MIKSIAKFLIGDKFYLYKYSDYTLKEIINPNLVLGLQFNNSETKPEKDGLFSDEFKIASDLVITQGSHTIPIDEFTFYDFRQDTDSRVKQIRGMLDFIIHEENKDNGNIFQKLGKWMMEKYNDEKYILVKTTSIDDVLK